MLDFWKNIAYDINVSHDMKLMHLMFVPILGSSLLFLQCALFEDYLQKMLNIAETMSYMLSRVRDYPQ